MKTRTHFFFTALTTVTLIGSCTKVIDVDLNSSDPQYVVEGNLPLGEIATIKITESINFDESNVFPLVENAIVSITDNQGNYELLSETSPGVYTSSSMIGELGKTYRLAINVGGKELSSQSIMPSPVSFDTMVVVEQASTGGGGPGGGGQGGGSGTSYDVTVQYTDLAGESNYYRFVEFVNGELEASHVFDDRLADGVLTQNTLMSFNRNLDSGDTLRVVMQAISKEVYEYYNSFENLAGGPQGSSTPANPYSNVIGTVLGYFSVYSSEEKVFIVP